MSYTFTIDQSTIIIILMIILWFFLPLIIGLKGHIYNYNRYRKLPWIILAIIISFPLLFISLTLRAIGYIGELVNYWSLVATSKLLGSVIKDEESSKKS